MHENWWSGGFADALCKPLQLHEKLKLEFLINRRLGIVDSEASFVGGFIFLYRRRKDVGSRAITSQKK